MKQTFYQLSRHPLTKRFIFRPSGYERSIYVSVSGTSPKDQADSDSCSDSDLATLERYRSNAEGGWVVVTIKLEYSDSTGVPAWIYYEANFFGRDGKEMVLPWESKIFFKNK